MTDEKFNLNNISVKKIPVWEHEKKNRGPKCNIIGPSDDIYSDF